MLNFPIVALSIDLIFELLNLKRCEVLTVVLTCSASTNG